MEKHGEKSLGSAIEKIKRDEQNKEAKLKAKRELEAARAAVERSLREIVTQIKKLQQEKLDLIKKTDELRAQTTIQIIRRDVLVSQLEASTIEMNKLKSEAEQSASELQQLRSAYCKTVQEISDKYDVWALLTKPSTELLPRTVAMVNKPSEAECNEKSLVNERRLINAKERLDKALSERERLKAEPETGEEFVRIKNALRYSLEMTANLRK